MSSLWIAITAFLAAGSAAGLVCVLLVKRWQSMFYRRVAALLSAVALGNLATAIGLLPGTDLLLWRQVAFIAEFMQPVLVIAAGMGASRFEAVDWWRTRWLIGTLITAGMVLGMVIVAMQAFQWKTFHNGGTSLVLGDWGRAAYGFVVLAMTVGVAQLEVVLRASREPLRQKLTFVIVGLGALAVYQIYQASQMLLFPVLKPEHYLPSGIVTIMALGLIAYGLGRNRLQELFVNTYVSHQAVVGSVSVIAIGGYLVVVGGVSTWLQETTHFGGKAFSVIVVFVALVGLVLMGFSTSLRGKMRQLLVRSFYRSKYDYRAQWLQATEAFQLAADRDAIMDTLLDFLIKTFPATSLSIWSFREADRRFVRIHAVPAEARTDVVELSHPVVIQLMRQDEAVALEPALMKESDGADLGEGVFRSLGIVLCVPVSIHGRLIAFIALGKPRYGDGYGADDCDLLRVIAHQVGMLLAHADLEDERRASVELDAVHRFSIFCLHDLKNLSARLSLVAQNAERYGEDQAFQTSAMRTVRDTAVKMTVLMGKLSLRSPKPSEGGVPEPIDLSVLIEDVVTPLKGDGVRWHINCGEVRPILAVREEIHQVLLNIILNAKQAISNQGDIGIVLSETREAVRITVNDTGCGISERRLETLFRPARSSRPGGLGIGLYQCKQIVEAYQGTIQIRSEVGQGTEVQVTFPLSPQSIGRPQAVLTNLGMSN